MCNVHNTTSVEAHFWQGAQQQKKPNNKEIWKGKEMEIGNKTNEPTWQEW